MSIESCKIEDLLGELNEVEKKNSPEEIFYSGRKELLSKECLRVSIIGTRKPSELGVKRAQKIAQILVEKKAVIVSGLAEGIDTTAHETAISLGGETLAVIGSGLDKFFPASNRVLQEKMMKEHLVISQFREGTPPNRTNFPQRNRTMALVSDATVIIEAKDKSGTYHQGWEALRLGRPLFIMQSAIEDESLTWTKEFLKYGAIPLTSPDSARKLFDDIPERLHGEEDIFATA